MQNELSQLSHRYSPTLGAHQLSAAPGTLKAKAAALGVTERSVTNYQCGARIPADAVQGKAALAFGITRAAWSQSAPHASAAPTSPRAKPTSSESSSESSTAPEAQEGSAAGVLAQLARLRARRESGTMSERAVLESEKLEAALHRDLAKHRGLTWDAIAESDVWAELEAKLVGTMHDSPWALARFLAVLDPSQAGRADKWRRDHPELVAAVEAAEGALLAAIEARHAARLRGAQ